MFGFFEPFSLALWGAIAGSLFILSIALVAVFTIVNAESAEQAIRAFHPRSLVQSLYHVWAAMLGGDDYDWASTNPGRLLRIAVLFMAVLLLSTYTADTASMFTAAKPKIHGPKDQAGLQQSRACYAFEKNKNLVQDFVREIVVPPPHLTEQMDVRAMMDWCLQELSEKRVEAFVFPETSLLDITFEHCDRVHLVPAIRFGPVFVGFLVTSEPEYRQLAGYLQLGVSYIRSSLIYSNLVSQHLHRGKTCETAGEHESEGISVKSMAGVFIVAGSLTCMSIVLAVIVRFCAKSDTQDTADDAVPHCVLGAAEDNINVP